ncbi:MAG: uL15m family ribosomal protein [Candidatus Aenigmatarchaeota archaeon]
MTSKKKRMRGSKSHGYGSKKKHRGAGSRGGRGYAGSLGHKRSELRKDEPDHLGKKGFKRPQKVVEDIKTINLKELDMNIDDLLEEGIASKEKNKIKINLNDLGYDKLLGSGNVNRPLVVEANDFSDSAKEKLKQKGGEAIELR